MDSTIVLFSIVLTFLLAALIWADISYLILPDVVNAALAISGVMQSIFLGKMSLTDATLGALLGSSMLSVVALSFHLRKGYAGLGMGDIKFAGAAGFWVGWQGIPLMLLLASLSGLAFAVIILNERGQHDPKRRIPFGPFLCGSTFTIWITQFVN